MQCTPSTPSPRRILPSSTTTTRSPWTTNFAAQSFWKDARIRFFRKKSAVLGLVLIVVIVLLAVLARA